jgi:LruC domain-containing protein
MKKTFLPVVFAWFLMASFTSEAQVILNAESGDRRLDAANCWTFGGITYTNSSTLRISGNWSMQSGQATNSSPNTFWIKSPWMTNLNGNVTLKVRLNAANGTTRGVVIGYLTYDPVNGNGAAEANYTVFHTFNWPSINTTVYDISTAIPAVVANSGAPFKIMISFVGTGGNSRIVSDDIVIPGTYVANPANMCWPTVALPDTDGDGVPDKDDDYPNDPVRAFRNFSPAPGSFGSIAFEDLWPFRGDYDFNDLVVDYQLEYATNADNLMVDLKIKLYIRAIGASIASGFGISFDNIPASKVASVSGMKLFDGYINLASNGLEAGHTNAVVIPFDNAVKCVNWGSQPTFNTTPGFAPGSSDTIVIVMLFSEPTPVAGLAVGSQTIAGSTTKMLGPATITINPFLIKGRNRGQEIHLPGMAPTTLANFALFGTGDDATNPTAGRYYVTKNNLPWAIHLPVRFDYPTEKTDVLKAYKKLADWAQSNGELYTDWYLNLPGYRDPEFIY